MLVWIDAASPSAALSVFGLTVTERHLHALLRLEQRPESVVISLGERKEADLHLPDELLQKLNVTFDRSTGTTAQRLRDHLEQAGDRAILILDGTALADARLHAQLSKRATPTIVLSPSGDEAAAIVYLPKAASAALPAEHDRLSQYAKSMISTGQASALRQEEFDGFIRKLRRNLPYYLFDISSNEAAARAERFMFWSNYKGSTDLFTRYVYPPLVWLLVRPLARARIHPNWVTLTSIVMTFGAIPFFAHGEFLIGFILAYGMSVLDSVDGKLARLTFTDSRLGNFLDHGLDMVHPPLWYVSWAYGLGLDQEGWSSPLGQAAILVFVFYVLDRLILKVYPRFFQRAFHTHSKLDATVRSFIARRNISLPVFLLGWLFGFAREAFFLIVAWQVLTAVYHGARTFWIIVVQKAHKDPSHKPVDVVSGTD